MPKQRYFVGIDLGTTFSSLAYVDEHGRVESLRLPDGTFQVASAVYFQSLTEVVIGTAALNYSVIEPRRVARVFKRKMGDAGWNFPVDGEQFRAEQLSAMVLKKLLEAARAKLGPIESAVISVPFVFDPARRKATQDAGRIAGLKSVELVEEPVAAALAYGHTVMQGGGFYRDEVLQEVFEDQNVLVYDLGGGTFDATILKLGKTGKFEVLATDGDERLGGENWDDVLLDLICEIYKKYVHRDPRDDLALLQELRLQAVEIKKSFSERKRVDFVFNCDGKKHSQAIPVGDFEMKTAHLLARTQNTIEEMLKRKGMGWGHIDRVLMVGGSSRMRQVCVMMERASGRGLDMSLSPDVAIANGAALYGAMLSESKPPMAVKSIGTVNSHALGLKIRDPDTHEMFNDVLIKVNEPTGSKVTRQYRLAKGSKKVSLLVLLGEHRDPAACVTLGKVRISDLPDNLPDLAELHVSFSFRNNGLLHVEGSVPRPGKPPLQVEFPVTINGEMSKQDVDDAAAAMRGIVIEE